MAKFIDAVDTALGIVATALIAFVAVSIASYVFLVPLNMALLKLGLNSIWWLSEGIEYSLYVGVFAGAPWVLRQGDHIRVDIFASMLPENGARRLEQFVNVLGAIICGALVFYGTRLTLWEFADGTLPNKSLRIANWYMIAVFATSFFLLGMEFLLRALRTHKDEPHNNTPERSAQ